MKSDRKNIPYRTFLDQFLSPEKKLVKALHKQDVEWVVSLVQNHTFEVNYRLTPLERTRSLSSYEDNGISLMHWLVHHKCKEGVQELLHQGSDPNIQTFFRETPAHWAASDGNEEMLLLLFIHGANFDLCQSQRGNFVEEDPYCPNVFEIFNTKTGKNWSKEYLSAKVLQKNIESNILQSASSRLRKM